MPSRRFVIPALAVVAVTALAPTVARASAAATASPADDTSGRVVVKFVDDARVRMQEDRLVSLAGEDLSGVEAVFAAWGSPPVVRLFTRPESEIDRWLAAAEDRSGTPLADLNGYYEVLGLPGGADALASSLAAIPVVETAYPAPPPVPPPADIPPATPDFEPDQGYLLAAPGGIDAVHAWAFEGGRGEGARIVDIEYDWTDTHEDLESALGGKTCYQPRGLYIDHGTAVLGEVGGGDNGYGVTGIANAASFGMVTQYPVGMSNSVARAIDCAASTMGPGDVMLLEAQTGGPNGAYVPVEWNQAEFDAIAAATAAGIVVVEAAGNGNEDLDAPEFLGRFNRSVRDSGAIIVGAGATPLSTQQDRSKLSFSTYGSRVDVQGWGERVTTAGYGGLFDGGGDPNQYYTSTFNGTSSASPIVTGAAAILQGIQMARTGAPLPPAEVRRILTETGTPQQSGPFPGSIGPRPDLARAIDALTVLLPVAAVLDDAAPLGNADGVLDPGETATLRVTLRNAGTRTAASVAGTLGGSTSDLRVTGPSAAWPDIPPGGDADTLSPHFRLTAQPGAVCGTTVPLALAVESDPYVDEAILGLSIGQSAGDYAAAGLPLTIPRNSSGGIVSSIAVADAFTIADAQVTAQIAHGDISQLRVTLASPAGTQVVLHDHGGAGTADLRTTFDRDTAPAGPGTMDDFDGEPSTGTWSLSVIDDQGGPVPAGALEAWSLALTATGPFRCDPLACGEPQPPEVSPTLILTVEGGSDLRFAWGAVAMAAGYRVWRAADAPFSAETLVGETTATTLLVPGEAGGGTDGYYRVRAVNACEWEGP